MPISCDERFFETDAKEKIETGARMYIGPDCTGVQVMTAKQYTIGVQAFVWLRGDDGVSRGVRIGVCRRTPEVGRKMCHPRGVRAER